MYSATLQARQRDIAARKREKIEQERERQRLLAELAKDKAERKARGGKLAGKLSVEGYQPTGLQADYSASSNGGSTGASGASSVAADGLSAADRVAKAVNLLANQKVGGEGGVTMKTVLLFVSNILKDPQEEKYRKINMENKIFKTKVNNCVGGTALLKAVGFEKVEEEDGPRLAMSREAVDEELLQLAKQKLETALSSYIPTIVTA
jgi:hypothetical protein